MEGSTCDLSIWDGVDPCACDAGPMCDIHVVVLLLQWQLMYASWWIGVSFREKAGGRPLCSLRPAASPPPPPASPPPLPPGKLHHRLATVPVGGGISGRQPSACLQWRQLPERQDRRASGSVALLLLPLPLPLLFVMVPLPLLLMMMLLLPLPLLLVIVPLPLLLVMVVLLLRPPLLLPLPPVPLVPARTPWLPLLPFPLADPSAPAGAAATEANFALISGSASKGPCIACLKGGPAVAG